MENSNLRIDTEKEVKKKSGKLNLGLKLILAVFIFFGLLIGIGLLVGLQVKKVYAETLKIQPLIEKAKGNLTAQDYRP